jgi:hypothetical protein
MLGMAVPVQHNYGIIDIIYSYLVNGYLALVASVMDIFHNYWT